MASLKQAITQVKIQNSATQQFEEEGQHRRIRSEKAEDYTNLANMSRTRGSSLFAAPPTTTTTTTTDNPKAHPNSSSETNQLEELTVSENSGASDFIPHSWEAISGNNDFDQTEWPDHISKPNKTSFLQPPSPSTSNSRKSKLLSPQKTKTKRASTAPAVRVGPASFMFGQQLGEGAYGRVVHAKRKDTNEQFAVKVMEKNFIKREKKVSFVMQEKNILSRLSHRNIVKLYFTFQDTDNVYMVMSLCYGELLHYIDHRANQEEAKDAKDVALTLSETQFYAAEIAEALEFLHANSVVHRDLKPENILLDYNGHVKVADFGTALDETKSDVNTSTAFCGTAQYVSPEVLEDRPATKGCDLWALGCIVFQVSN